MVSEDGEAMIEVRVHENVIGDAARSLKYEIAEVGLGWIIDSPPAGASAGMLTFAEVVLAVDDEPAAWRLWKSGSGGGVGPGGGASSLLGLGSAVQTCSRHRHRHKSRIARRILSVVSSLFVVNRQKWSLAGS
jgi:hypothetical protein